ncbi:MULTISPECIES: helix-turn-helix transcriptional regulator [unclassified Nocardiopsis]|uniref:helix-turn-helix domain-containing protein n=1 Tax=unclassified Nocardiopsis TaxID=2649073 RepID=UPI00135A726B|nr:MULTISPECIES: helix-turn-helix transcriptional regulator [unclassified Nocardiopsis]
MPSDTTPTFRRLLLGRELRELRETRGLTAKAVSSEMEVAPSWVTRIENGQRGIQIRDLKRLFELYRVDDDRKKEKLLELARQAKQQGWWEPYKSTLPPRYADYVGLESSACSIRNTEVIVVPGLLQTEGYARHLLTHGMHDFTPEEVESRLRVRLQRQQNLLDRSQETRLDAILDEAVLRRQVGGPQIMREQLAHLLDSAERDNITLRILPLASGVHAGASGSFVILDFPAAAMDPIPYIETVAGDLYLEKHSDIELCEETWRYLWGQALSPADSRRLVAEIMKTYEAPSTESSP